MVLVKERGGERPGVYVCLWMRWPRLNFNKMPLIVLVTVVVVDIDIDVDVGGVAKMKLLLLLVYQSYVETIQLTR